MPINFGYRLEYTVEQSTSMLLMLHVHASYLHALLRADDMRIAPYLTPRIHHDVFGNTCAQVEAPAGRVVVSANAWIDETAIDTAPHPFAKEHPLSLLPDEALVYLRASKHCDVDAQRLPAVQRFGLLTGGWNRVQAISNFARRWQEHAAGDSNTASATAAGDALHLAISLCRALNIPARYSVGYVVRESAEETPQDFTAWFEAYLGGTWQAFDPGSSATGDAYRIALSHGRDAADVPICTTLGPSALKSARVWAQFRPLPVQRRAVPSPGNYLDERYGAAVPSL